MVARIRMGDSLIRQISPTGPQVRQTCLRAVVQLPCVTPEAHPPRTDPPANLGRQVWHFNYDASQIEANEVFWRYCCPVAVKTICVAGACRIGVHMVSVFLSEMVRPNASKPSMKTAIIRSSSRSDCDTMHASSCNIPQIEHRAHSNAPFQG